MNRKDNDFRERLLSTFKVEAQDHLKTIQSGLVELERMPPIEVQMEVVETAYRASHSLKGAARAVNMTDIESVCQAIEGVFGAWKWKGLNQSPELFDALYLSLDTIRTILTSYESGQTVERGRVKNIIKELARFEQGFEVAILEGDAPELDDPGLTGETPKTLSRAREERPWDGRVTDAPQPNVYSERRYVKERAYLSDTVRISTSKLSALLLRAEEMLTAKLASRQHSSGLVELYADAESLSKECRKSCHDLLPGLLSAEKAGMAAQQAVRVEEFLNRLQVRAKALEERVAALLKSSRQHGKNFDRMADSLLDDMKKAMMLPFSTLLESFPMLVRDIAHEQRKDVELVLQGQEIEVDRRILEEMKDPLMHIVRNCVDHGIEKPVEREALKKQRRGTVRIAVSHVTGNRVEILVSDDGAGVDLHKVGEAAVKAGMLTRADEESLTEEEALSIIFRSGFSTSPIITDISGRGLGLAIVREKVEKLGGAISAQTKRSGGTAFRIILPLTVATFRGVLVRVEDQVFIIPTANVERTVKVRDSDIKTVENRETLSLAGRPVSFVKLAGVLDIPVKKKTRGSSGAAPALVLSSGEKPIAFGVDEVLNEQEVLVKGLGRQLSKVRNIAGAAVLGSGKAVPVLNVPDLMRSAVKASAGAPVESAEDAGGRRAVILVAEDSITSRILLKNILESAGYEVKTAVDGIDAFTALRSEDFDLVVSDVEMPRMNGFDLTSKIRGDKKLADLPVVLVTALETREDRERGISVGANAYIVKSSFNQGNLLEVIRRLI
ncbi:MAG: hybrid sensor histidine kinase/response regulator [Deltaproteobacteria bacterium]|nr:hybrid sensor histidine kinase/response regulator [Deltaproteobacteria bacterium]